MIIRIANRVGFDYSRASNPVVRLMQTMKHSVISTKFGWIVIDVSERGLCSVALPVSSWEEAVAGLGDHLHGGVDERSLLGDLPQRLQRYFAGEAVKFPDKLDLRNATVFERTVWDAVRSIPYGETRSYAWVADRAGKPRAFRAVGQAMARNRFPIIVPCHRVIAADGSLGGFSGGLELKRSLLALEAR